MTQLHIGDMAPDFSLNDHHGEVFNLGTGLKQGPVVLVFYTMDGSPTCTTFLCAINKDVEAFARRKLQIVGINYADVDRHARLASSKFLKLQLLSDNQYRVAKSYGCLFEIGPIKAIRYAVVGIDTDGRVKYFQRGKPTNDEIFRGMGIMPVATAAAV